VHAFELAALDYLLQARSARAPARTLTRAHERLEQADYDPSESSRVHAAAAAIEVGAPGVISGGFPCAATRSRTA